MVSSRSQINLMYAKCQLKCDKNTVLCNYYYCFSFLLCIKINYEMEDNNEF